ncbi:MAG: type II-A CRISPR-associated protein Csn2 [Coriobacteriia bacterium]|nr:type II-A CRISPR-associated protein Csn2 [Coriobacteriia bacterium]
MRLFLSSGELPLAIDMDKVATLEILHRPLFARVAQEFVGAVEQDEQPSEFRLSTEEGRDTSFSRFLYVADFLTFDASARKITSRLHKSLIGEFVLDEELRERSQQAFGQMMEVLSEQLMSFESRVSFEGEFSLERYLRMINFKIALDESNSIIERIIGIIDLVADLQIWDAILFINLKGFLTEEEFYNFVDYCLYQKVSTLIIESAESEWSHEGERKLVVDEDRFDYLSSTG